MTLDIDTTFKPYFADLLNLPHDTIITVVEQDDRRAEVFVAPWHGVISVPLAVLASFGPLTKKVAVSQPLPSPLYYPTKKLARRRKIPDRAHLRTTLRASELDALMELRDVLSRS